MSEDIDFKIVPLPGNEDLKSTALKRELSALKRSVSAALVAAGFQFDEKDEAQVKARNQNQYIVYQLPYVGEFALGQGLRSTIQVELTLDPLLSPPVTLPVSSFLAEAFNEPPEVPGIACVSVMETAAEKLVALTRRTAMELAGIGKERDHTLVRHLYDLQCLRHRLSVGEIGDLVETIMGEDAQDYANQFPAYRADPVTQSRAALLALSTNPVYAEHYAAFVRDMVFGEEVPKYQACVTTAAQLLRKFIVTVEGAG